MAASPTCTASHCASSPSHPQCPAASGMLLHLAGGCCILAPKSSVWVRLGSRGPRLETAGLTAADGSAQDGAGREDCSL